jgi:hypothetical protein
MRGEIPNVVRYLLGLLVGLIYGISFSAMHYSRESMPGLGIILFTTAVCFLGWALMAGDGLRKAFSAASIAWRSWKQDLDADVAVAQVHRLPVRIQE